MSVKSLAPWFGSNRLLAPHVGKALAGCNWVGVPFAGGMCELPHITARTVLVNDLHRGVINLARCVREHHLRKELVRKLEGTIFHPDTLAEAQRVYAADDAPRVVKAWAFFVCAWMTRSGSAGTADETTAKLALRWTAGGGDSAVRFRSAVRAIAEWWPTFQRCTFSVMDAFDFLARCEDRKGHGVYCDAPFPGAGQEYKHGPKSDADDIAFHTRLRDTLARFERTRVVCRFYRHPLIEDLYPADRWTWQDLEGGRKQTGAKAPEVLLVNFPEVQGCPT